MSKERHPGTDRYRRWSGVSVRGRVLYSTRPLSVIRLNDTAVEVIEAVSERFRSAGEIADAAGQDRNSVARLLDRLHRRGFLEWAPDRDVAHTPPVSIVVTVRNGSEQLGGCLDALGDLEYPEYEIVVIDDGSTDDTAPLARSHASADQGRVEVVSVGSPDDPLGIGASRNRGVAVARHDVLAFTDADCRPRADWLSELVPCLATHDMIGGRVRPHDDRPVDAYEGVNSSLDMGEHAARVDPDSATPYLPTANLVGHRVVFETVPFPDRNVAEDVDICWRAVDHGFDVVYSPTGVVEHDYRAALRAFADRRAVYASSEALLAHTYHHGDRVPLPVGFLLLLGVLLAMLAVGVGTTTVLALATVGFVLLVGSALAGSIRRLDGLEVVSVADVSRSYGRSVLSTWYACCREVTRYYSVPIGIASVVLALAWPVAGSVILGTVLVCIALPPVIEYAVHRPDSSLVRYACYYLADHFGYQCGVYRGAITHRTGAHLAPWARFRPAGAFGGILDTLSERTEPDDERRIVIGDTTAHFRTTTDAERWWFDTDDLRGERLVIDDLLSVVREEDVFFDVGANVGLYTCFVGQHTTTETVAFEPHATNADRLAANAERNGLDVRVERLALGSSEGDGHLLLDGGEPGQGEHALRSANRIEGSPTDDSSGSPSRALAATDQTGEPRTDSGSDARTTSKDPRIRVVPVERGDTFVDRTNVPSPTVVKVDVEGAELDVLAGLERALSTTCRLVYCEIHPNELANRGARPADVERFLQERGFTCERLNRAGERYRIRARRAGEGDPGTRANRR